MSNSNDLLVEIGTEELPPKALLSLSNVFADEIEKGLRDEQLDYGIVERFATPRRMAVRIQSLVTTQPDQTLVRQGPTLRAAYDDKGNHTKAALGFARSCGVDLAELSTEGQGNAERLVFTQRRQGAATESLLLDIIRHALKALPIPKRMRWGDLESEFVRPVHWFLVLFGTKKVSGIILDVEVDNLTYGHRFHHPGSITVTTPLDYERVLRDQGFVEPDFAVRKESIRTQILTLASSIDGQAKIDSALLDEVCSLTEWPVAVMGSFDTEFLKIPSEALIETMQINQKYFPILDQGGSLKAHFITLANIDSRDPDQIIAGNERVIAPRFKDAAFFWHQDLKQALDKLVPALAGVVYQKQLGTLLDKTQRLSALSSHIASMINVDGVDAMRAGLLCKCDLLTNMVGEFASLQGIMGKYYAQASGENSEVCSAIEEHYHPRFAGDVLPITQTGQILALADRLDTLIGIFVIGQKPTGEKDPFGLRRASLGVLRILIEIPLALDLKKLLHESAEQYPQELGAKAVIDDVYKYILERLKTYYSERNIPGTTIEAVLAVSPSIPLDIHRRIIAIEEFKTLPQSTSLAAAHKRSNNLLKKSSGIQVVRIDLDYLEANEERELYNKIEEYEQILNPLIENRHYSDILIRLAELKDTVDNFFDKVRVLVDDDIVRRNRLALLHRLNQIFMHVADLSKLQNQ